MESCKMSPTIIRRYPQDCPRQKWKLVFKLYKLASHLSAPEGGIIKWVQPCNSLPVNKTSVANHITCLPHPPLQKIFPQVIAMMEKDMRQSSNCKTECTIWPFMLKWWWHVFSPGSQTASWKQLCTSSCERSQGACRQQTLGTHQAFWCPKNLEIVPSVWAMCHKCSLTTNEVTKYKARLNIHGGKQTYGIN